MSLNVHHEVAITRPLLRLAVRRRPRCYAGSFLRADPSRRFDAGIAFPEIRLTLSEQKPTWSGPQGLPVQVRAVRACETARSRPVGGYEVSIGAVRPLLAFFLGVGPRAERLAFFCRPIAYL